MKPSVGRTAHYVSWGSAVQPDGSQAYHSQCRAAVITETDTSDTVGLCVLNPTGLFFNRTVTFDGGEARETATSLCSGLTYRPGSWHWPARVE
jgi:hypothetical protein